MPDLSTTYLGLPLRNPLVASSSPLSQRIDHIRQLADAGVGAIVLHSLFEEQILHERTEVLQHMDLEIDTFHSYLPYLANFSLGPENYLDHIRQAKELTQIPIIGSLNGISDNGWIEYAAKIQEAGADALELNLFYLPTNFDLTSTLLEEVYVTRVQQICQTVSIPVAVKLSPFFTAIPNMAKRFTTAGAHGLVLFNRFYQPDIDLTSLSVKLIGELSGSRDLRLPLRWIAMLYRRLDVDFALSSGVHTVEDAVKAILVGAQVTMMASALITNGPSHITTIIDGLQEWMDQHHYASLDQFRGQVSQQALSDPTLFERAQYMNTLANPQAKILRKQDVGAPLTNSAV
jgi:dihydroorotate dehydrogenase (fumarate)